MAERTTCLSIATLFEGNHNHPDIGRFLGEFGSALYAGEGKKPQFLDAMGITIDMPLRLLVGTPTKSLTRQHRLIAEAAISMVFGRDLGDTKGVWTTGNGWRPVNAGRVPAPLTSCTLDHSWMLSLGIQKSIWEKSVLFAPAFTAPPVKSASATMRNLLAIAAYGFCDPYQFFTADR